MCGIAGAWTKDPGEALRAVERMCQAMTARGPDGEGVVLLPIAGGAVALGNRRLAVIDPSPAGHQPMADPERGTVIVFNGFIANFVELRRRLEAEGERFASRCDTEVVLRAYGRYGPACIGMLRGMFALAVWDPRAEALFLARDPFGVKPLYYYHRGDRLLFASQVRALLVSGLVSRTLSNEGLATFLAFGAVREPLTAIAGVYALPPGHTATVRRGRLEPVRYWQAPQPALAPPTLTPGSSPINGRGVAASRSAGPPLSAQSTGPILGRAVPRRRLAVGWGERWSAARALRALLAETVTRYLSGDVPLGVFLSGGLDSAVLAALAAHAPGRPARITAVSLVDEANEAEVAAMRAVARAVGLEHVVAPLRWPEVERWLPRAFAAMDQPTFDGLNTYAVARAAAESGLKVALSGLGADELFDGYGYGRRVVALERARRLPGLARRVAAPAAGLLPGRKGEKARCWLEGQLPTGAAHELLRRLFLPREVERLLASSGRPVPPAQPSPQPADVPLSHAGEGPPGEVQTLLDLAGYTRDVLLRDTDCMSMAHGLEVRVPYLDHVLVEFVLRLPTEVRAAPGKGLLAETARDLLPPVVPARHKRGFVLPFDRWLRGPLRHEVAATFSAPPHAVAMLLDQTEMMRLWRRFFGGGTSWHGVWALYALCRWVASLAEVEGMVLESGR